MLPVLYIAAIEELAKHCSTTSVMLSDHHSLGSFPLSEFGTKEKKMALITLDGGRIGVAAQGAIYTV